MVIYESDDNSNLSVSDFETTVKLIRAMGSADIAIWFVDRRELYQRFRHIFQLEVSEVTGIVMLGMTIYEWYMHYFDPESEAIAAPGQDYRVLNREVGEGKKVWPWFCATPGVWGEMSDGKHRRFFSR